MHLILNKFSYTHIHTYNTHTWVQISKFLHATSAEPFPNIKHPAWNKITKKQKKTIIAIASKAFFQLSHQHIRNDCIKINKILAPTLWAQKKNEHKMNCQQMSTEGGEEINILQKWEKQKSANNKTSKRKRSSRKITARSKGAITI